MSKKKKSIVEVSYDDAKAGKKFNRIAEATIPSGVRPAEPKAVADWDHDHKYSAETIELAERIQRCALPSLVDSFEFDQHIGGIRATDLFSLNTLMGATIEDQVVSTLNKHRETWDTNSRWSEYTFVRSAQSFPDVRLVHRSNSEDIKLGIELKSWFLLAKEGVPSMRFAPHPDACAPLDMVCVVPWYLSNAVCGVPKVAEPWVQQAKFAAEWSKFFWTYLRQTDDLSTLSSREFEENNACSPYPKKSDAISLHPKNDSGKNFGRLPRYHPIMDDFCCSALRTEILGIQAEDWRYFLQLHTESATIEAIKKDLTKQFGITDFSDSDKVLELISEIIQMLPKNLIR